MPTRTSEPTAIVGIACRFPGARDPNEFWENLLRGHDAIGEIPAERWSRSEYNSDYGVEGHTRSRWCGLIDDVARFDARFFQISAREARSMDPQQRLLLEESWHCLEDAAIVPQRLSELRTGVFVGVMADDYQQRLIQAQVEPDAFAALGNYECILANRLSHFLKLSGPSLSVNAACASSLVALHLARRALAAGDCDYALVGAANLNLHPWKYRSFSQAGMLSPGGRCRTFDVGADGYVPGDGIAVVLLTSLERAQEQGHRIHAVISGSATNHVGGGRSITAPSVASQRSLIEASAADAGISLDSLQYVEAHGTGTSLGDPIEVAALEQAFATAGVGKNACALGSVKSSIGHLEAAAGLAGLLKLVLMLRHGMIPPTLHVEQPNPLLDLETSCFRLALAPSAWPKPAGSPRRAGLSSFGFGGANAHLIIEQATSAQDPQTAVFDRACSGHSGSRFELQPEAEVFCVSGHSADALLRNLQAWLRCVSVSGGGERASLRDLCGVAAQRPALAYRYAVCVRSHEQLAAALTDAIATSQRDEPAPSPQWVLRFGQVEAGQGVAAYRRLAALGLVPELVCFDAGGWRAALEVSGVCADPDAPTLSLARPSIALSDPVGATILRPLRARADYLLALRTASRAGCDAVAAATVRRGRALWQRQLTFSKYLREWQAPLAADGIELEAALAAPMPAPALVLAVLVALREVDERWMLARMPRGDERFAELIDFVVDGALSRADAIALLGEGDDEALRLALDSGLQRADLRRPYSELRRYNSELDEVGDPRTWLAALGHVPTSALPENRRVVRIGGDARACADEWVLSAYGEADWGEFLSRLWCSGAPLALERLYPSGRFVVVDAPGYRFGGARAWVELPTSERDGEVVPLQASESGCFVRSLMSSQSTRLDDSAPWSLLGATAEHRIGGRLLVPGACMIEPLLAAFDADIEQIVLLRPLELDPDDPTAAGLDIERDDVQVTVSHAGQSLLRARLGEYVRVPQSLEWSGGPLDTQPDASIYEAFAARGYEYGMPLRTLGAVRAAAEGLAFGLTASARTCLAGLIEAGFQAVLTAARVREPATGVTEALLVPFAVGHIHRQLDACATADRVLVDFEALSVSRWGVRGRAHICDARGRVLLELDGVDLRRLPTAPQTVAGPTHDDRAETSERAVASTIDPQLLHRLAWRATAKSTCFDHSEQITPGALWIIGGANEVADGLYALQPKARRIDPRELGDWRQIERLFGSGQWPQQIVLTLGFDDAVARPTHAVIDLCRALARVLRRSQAVLPIWLSIATVGLHAVESGETVGAPELAAALGAAKSAAREIKGLEVLALDLDRRPSSWQLQNLLLERGPAPLLELAYRGERRYALQLESVAPAFTAAQPLREGGVYVIVGGLGGLGLALARSLAQGYRARLALIGRRAPDSTSATVVAELERLGSEAVYLSADACDRAQLAAALDGVRARYGRIDGTVHSAVVMSDRSIQHMDASHFEQVYAAKAEGSQLLAELTAGDHLDFLAFFSSILVLQGNAGQANYVAGCAYQDALAAWLRAHHGRAALSIDWGYWGEVGVVADAHHAGLLYAQGIPAISVADGVAGFAAALASGETRMVVARLSNARRASMSLDQRHNDDLHDHEPPPLTEIAFSDAATQSVIATTADVQAGNGLGTDLSEHELSVPPPLQPMAVPIMTVERLRTTLSQITASVLEVEVRELDPSDNFTDLGVDSILGVELIAKVNAALGTCLEPTVVYDYPTIQALANKLHDASTDAMKVAPPVLISPPPAAMAMPASVASAPPPPAPVSTTPFANLGSASGHQPDPALRDRNDDIAVIGIAGRFPGARDLDELWANIAAGVDSIVEVPKTRWDVEVVFDADPRRPNTTYCRYGGFLNAVDHFDAEFFKITPREAEHMDPQQRLLLEESWRALEDGGYAGVRRAQTRLGVFVGARQGDYLLELYRRGQDLDAASFTGTDTAMLAGRIAYQLDATGPAISVDTACSASLVAIHQACQQLQSGGADLALAGGVFVMNTAQFHIMASKAGMLASSGRCRAFDHRAEGFVPGEGVGMVLLKPAAAAIADGDHIYGLIKASGVNQDGRTNGITAPSARAQTRLIREVQQRGAIDPGSISYVEAHGTGTKLGDPIEIEGLCAAFETDGALPPASCGLGSIKTNIGHAATAAGVASLLKVLLAMRARQLPPSLHYERENAHIGFARTPFRVVTELEHWPDKTGPRRAAISSFGFSGTNCHMIVEQAPVAEPSRASTVRGELFAISAATEEALIRRIGGLRDWLRGHERERTPVAIDIADIAYSLAMRHHERHRVAFVAADWYELAGRLEQMLEVQSYRHRLPFRSLGAEAGEGGGRALLRRFISELVNDLTRPQGDAAERQEQLEALADAYAGGHVIDWLRLYAPGVHRIVPLPTYPFAGERHWPDDLASASIHPMLAPQRAAAAPSNAMRILGRRWIPAPPLAVAAPLAAFGSVVILVGHGDRGLAQQLCERLHTARLVATPQFGGRDLAAKLLADGPVDVLIDLGDVGGGGAAAERIALLQALLEVGRQRGLSVLHVADRQVVIEAKDGADAGRFNADAALLAALIARLRAEHRAVRACSLDIDTDEPSGDLVRTILAELANLQDGDEHGQIALRRGCRHRLELTVETVPAAGALQVSAQGVYLISGGVRGLGLEVARWLVARGARKLLLFGRQPIPETADWAGLLADSRTPALVRERIAPLQALINTGVSLEVHAGPLDDHETITELLDRVRRVWGPVSGYVHCAGAVDLEQPIFVNKSAASLARVIAPKLAGLVLADVLLKRDRLDFSIMFSSVSALIPRLAAGMLDYAAANAVLATWAERRRAEGHACWALAWGNWIGTGMGSATGRAYSELGLQTHGIATGLDLLDRALSIQSGVLIPLVVESERFDPHALVAWPAPAAPTAIEASWAGQVAQLEPMSASTPVLANPRWTDSDTDVEALLPRVRVVAALRTVLGRVLRMPESKIDADAGFGEMGIDSILLVEFNAELEQWLGVKLDPSLALDHPSLAALAEALERGQRSALAAAVGGAASPSPPANVFVPPPVSTDVAAPASDRPPSSAPTTAAASGLVASAAPSATAAAVPAASSSQHAKYPPIAIIGMAGRLPDAPDLDAYWRQLRDGRDCTRDIPAARWSIDRHYQAQEAPGKSISKRGGFIDGIELFDPEYFGFSVADAAEVDPLIRQFLEIGAGCFHHAGYAREELAGRSVGVFVGARVGNYAERLVTPGRRSLLGVGQNFIASHLSHHYDLRGPAMVVDTACSSSLTALHQAIASLHAGECECALAGGVEILLDEVVYQRLSEARVLSPDGRCSVFDERANGFVPGEGAGAVLLTTLERALAQGDRIYAVIEATAVNNDGRTMGVTTPNPVAQQCVVREALRRAGLDARAIGYVEAHGTGTALGDPLELRALTELFAADGVESGSCPVGSVKSNLGHLLSAAGIASLLKVVLALGHRELPPTLHCDKPNPRFDFAASPFRPCTRREPWTGPLRAGISSFGFGGTNVHAIVAAAPEHQPTRQPLPPPRFERRRFWLERRQTDSVALSPSQPSPIEPLAPKPMEPATAVAASPARPLGRIRFETETTHVA